MLFISVGKKIYHFNDVLMKDRITQEEIVLIKSAQSGDERAFAKLFNRYKLFVDTILSTYIGDKDEARDITNIVFLKVHSKLSKFTDYSSFGGWLRIIARNVAIDYLRTVKDSSSINDEIFVDPSSLNKDSECSIIDDITYQEILQLIEDVAPLYRDTAYMYYRDGMSIAEISKALHVSKGTIKSRLHRMRIKLKNFLEHVNDSPTISNRSDDNLCDCTLQQE